MNASFDGDLGFAHRKRKNGDIEVLHHGRVATTLRGRDALDFVDEVEQCLAVEAQQLMARVTGSYKHGTEPRAATRAIVGEDHRQIGLQPSWNIHIPLFN